MIFFRGARPDLQCPRLAEALEPWGRLSKPLALVALSGTDYPVKEIAEAITLRLAELLMLTVEQVLGFRATLQTDEPRLWYPVVAQSVNRSPYFRSG